MSNSIDAIRAYVERVATDDDRELLEECRAARPTDQPGDRSHGRTWGLWAERVGAPVVPCTVTADACVVVQREGRGRVARVWQGGRYVVAERADTTSAALAALTPGLTALGTCDDGWDPPGMSGRMEAVVRAMATAHDRLDPLVTRGDAPAVVVDALRDLGDMLREIGDDRERAARAAETETTK